MEARRGLRDDTIPSAAYLPKFDTIPDGCPDLGIASCFECFLPRCRYEMSARHVRSFIAHYQLVPLFDASATNSAIVAETGMAMRTVMRHKALWKTGAWPSGIAPT